MVYRGGSQQNEIAQLSSEIFNEVQRDSAPIAAGIFGSSNSGMPDVKQVSNQKLDALYRQKYQAGDREWLVNEAHRDPNQFLQVAERIGVQKPPPPPEQGGPAPQPFLPPPGPPPQPALPMALPMPGAAPPGAVPPPQPGPLPVGPPIAGPPQVP